VDRAQGGEDPFVVSDDRADPTLGQVTFGLSLYTGQQRSPMTMTRPSGGGSSGSGSSGSGSSGSRSSGSGSSGSGSSGSGTSGGGASGARYQDLAPIAAAAEAAGFDMFWASEHHDFDDGYLPSPLVGLAAAASATRTIGLGTGLSLGPLAHPLRLAEDAVVVDHLSGGRLVLGLGIGYAPEEYRMFGIPMEQRGRRLAETIDILRRAWRGERFSFEGQVFSLTDVRVRPASLRPEGIPIWLGGYAARAIERAGRMADGHLVGRGTAELVANASACLAAVRAPSDPSFTFAVNLAAIGDDPAAGGDSARRAFARQQHAYEQVQEGTDVYADQIQVTATDTLDLGAIDDYLQLHGDTDSLVRGIIAHVTTNRSWARQHITLRVLFPDEATDVVLRRISYFGEEVLGRVRAALAASSPATPLSTTPAIDRPHHRQERTTP
jgi:alkanesulfonate monooxygenase SsuD/methylene tetrahydromethanopterin reductase-like flavin-dependent oxidoreductase (luciferase family)